MRSRARSIPFPRATALAATLAAILTPISASVFAAILTSILAAGPARATRTVITATEPYWTVGERDKALSGLCAIGRFNERDREHYVIRFVGKTGGGVLGIAKGTGFNLYDPAHHRVRKEDYFFLKDGTSSCAVFVGGR